MFILGVRAAVVVGISLGLLGGGGPILTVPTIHYIFGVEAHAAITSTLLIVGVTSMVALVPHLRAKRVRIRIGLVFGMSSMVSAQASGKLAKALSNTPLESPLPRDERCSRDAINSAEPRLLPRRALWLHPEGNDQSR